MGEKIGQMVRNIRNGAPDGGMSQKQFAAVLGISQAVVSDIETGRREPSKKVAWKLANYSGKPLTDFISCQ